MAGYRDFNDGWLSPEQVIAVVEGQLREGLQWGNAVGGNPMEQNQPYQQGMRARYEGHYYYDFRHPNVGEVVMRPWGFQMELNRAYPPAEVHVAATPPVQDVRSRSVNVEGAEASGVSVACELSEELSAKVFENDMLREKILRKVIFSSNGSVSTAGLKNVRLVRKSWLVTSADIFRQGQLPMFHLTLDAENSTKSCIHVMRHGSKLLTNFVRFMTSSRHRLLNFIPPFSLHLKPEFFRRGNYKDLSNCLVSCGVGLISLDLEFPVNSSLSFGFPPFELPNLQRLSVHYSNYIIQNLPVESTANSRKTIYPVQIILSNVSDELKELTFKYSTSQALIPHNFNTLKLPQSITKLSLDCPLTDNDLDLLIRNELLNISSLSLYATNVPYSPQKITRILENLRLSLRSLSLGGGIVQRQAWNPTILRLPVMENLEFLQVTSKCWAFEEDVLERQLPTLTELQILNMREETFNRWTGASVFPEVKKVSVSLIHENIHPYNLYSTQLPKTMTLENMTRLNHTFSNIVSLELTIREPLSVGLKYLFDEMRCLQELTITVRGAVEIEDHGPWHWDAVLTGLSEDLVKCFRRNQAYCGAMELRDDFRFPSIKKLTALKSLVLKESLTQADPWTLEPHWSLISDVTFHFALLKMPNLVNLELCGRFKASQQMTEQWRMQKGTEINGIDRD